MNLKYEQMDLELFFGRFHPLVVHLPIGFLLIAAILEALSLFSNKRLNSFHQSITITLLCSGFGAVASAAIGYLLAEGGSYDENTLFWHKWLGIGLAILSFVAWALKAGIISVPQKVSSAFIFILVLLVSITGHLGGNLTHGSDYLFAYAPSFVKQIVGVESDNLVENLPKDADSVQVFTHLVKPMLETKCYACHSATKSNGGLVLSTKEGITKGGDTGNVLVGSDPFASPLFLRTTLPQSNVKFMPPKGEPLTYSEMKILEWWIKSGADYNITIAQTKAPKEIQKFLLRDYGIDTQLKPHYDKIDIAPLAEDELRQLAEAGFNVKTLSIGHPMVEARLNASEIASEQLTTLENASKNIIWLDLTNKAVRDEMLTTIGQFENLMYLELNKNPISDAGLKQLQSLKHLEVLNLQGTQITDESIELIAGMKSLKRVYLWQTGVTSQGIQTLQENASDLKIIGGANF